MKKQQKYDLDALSRYIDGELDDAQRALVERQLQTDPVLRQQYQSLLDAHQLLRSSAVLAPSTDFTVHVMERLHRDNPAERPVALRKGIFILIGLLVICFVATVLVSAGAFDNDVPLANPAPQMLKRWVPGNVFIDGKLLTNAIIMINLALAWWILDRVILRPWFRQRSMNAGDPA